jgi:hypothetical protein
MGISENDRFYRKNINDYPEHQSEEKGDKLNGSNPRINLL